MINKRITSLKPSATLAINLEVKRLRSENKEIVHFGFGQSPFLIHKSIVNELKKHAANNHYLPTLGLEELRKEIASFLSKHQNISTNKDAVFIGPGSKELLFQTILMLKVRFLIPKGSWVSYVPQIKSIGGKYEILDTFLEDNFKLSAKSLKDYCEKNSKKEFALILNSPNNPTGAVYTKNELKELAKVCKKYNSIVLSDEIYSQLNFTEDYSPSISEFYSENTIVFGGLSKVFSAGGYRLGFMVLPKNLAHLKKSYQSLFSETFSAVASPVQYAAVKAFKMPKKLQKYIKEQSSILEKVSEFIYKNLSEIGVECTKSNGAFYMMIGFEKFKSKITTLGIKTSKELADYLLDKYNVALLPASDFYFKDEDLFFRLAFVDFNGKKVLKAYKKEEGINEEFIKKHCPNIFLGVTKLRAFVTSL